MGEKIFPAKIEEKPGYFAKVMPFLDTNKVKYKIDVAKLTEAQDLYGPVATPGTYLYCKDKYDKGGKRKDTLVVAELAEVTENLEKKLTEIYNDIAVSLWDAALRDATKRKTGLPHTPSHITTPIKEKCVLDVDAKLSGLFNGGARTSTDTKKHDIPAGANALELAYVIMEGKRKIGTETMGKVRQKCDGPEDDTKRQIFTKALFSLKIDESLAGFDLYCWGRWTNVQHPALAGEWSEMHIMMIR